MAKIQITLPDGTALSHDLPQGSTTIGRADDNSFAVSADSFSGHHAEISVSGNTFSIKDLQSTNGTFLNGAKITESPLSHGDKILFGKISAVFLTETATRPTPPPAPAFQSSPQPQEEAPALPSPAQNSVRPADFKNSSPYPKEEKDGPDTVRMAAYALALVASLVFFFSVYAATIMMEIPVFQKP